MTNTVKMKCSIWAEYNKYSKEFRFNVFNSDTLDSKYLLENYIPISLYEIEIEMPSDIDLHKNQLATLQQKRKLILAENQSKLNQVDNEIQEFMAIENKS